MSALFLKLARAVLFLSSFPKHSDWVNLSKRGGKDGVFRGLASTETVVKLVPGLDKGLLANIVRSPELAELNDLVVLKSVDFATLAGSTLADPGHNFVIIIRDYL